MAAADASRDASEALFDASDEDIEPSIALPATAAAIQPISVLLTQRLRDSLYLMHDSRGGNQAINCVLINAIRGVYAIPNNVSQ
jgi:hypothetical protein